MKEIFFKYNNEEEFYKLQDILLELGYEWLDSGKRRIKYSMYSPSYILSLKNDILSIGYEEKCMEFYKGELSKDDIEVYIEARKLNIL